MTRGMSLNNPGNLMHYDGIIWQGEIVPTSDPEGRLCQFDTITDGVRAMAKNLVSYFIHDKLNTIDQIITRYAPPNENNTAAYIAFVARECGVEPNAVVNIADPAFLRLLVSSIIRQEQGNWAGVPYAVLEQGVDEALG